MNDNFSYSEYLAEHLEKNIAYSEYIAENLDKSIAYSEYIAENIGYNTPEIKAKKVREMRKKKLERIFK